jgi:hypothetical protein
VLGGDLLGGGAVAVKREADNAEAGVLHLDGVAGLSLKKATPDCNLGIA